MDEPELGISRSLSFADEVVSRGSQEVAPGQALEGPTAGKVVADGDLELGRLVAFLLGRFKIRLSGGMSSKVSVRIPV